MSFFQYDCVTLLLLCYPPLVAGVDLASAGPAAIGAVGRSHGTALPRAGLVTYNAYKRGSAMINNIVLENFKCFRKVEVNPRLITVFVGPNGTGKSSVLQALALLKQSVGSSSLTFRKDLLDFSGPEDILPRFDGEPRIIYLSLGGIYTHETPGDQDFGRRVRYAYQIGFSGKDLDSHSLDLWFEYQGKPCRLLLGGQESSESHDIGPYGLLARLENTVATTRIGGWRGREPPPETKRAIENLTNTATLVMKAVKLVHATRGFVQPMYPLGNEKAEDIPISGGLGQHETQTATNLALSRSIEEKISGWLYRITKVGLRIDPISHQRFRILALSQFGEVNIVTEGFGSNTLIGLLLELATVPSGATVMIEEPEIHLHPKAQAELASLLAEVAKAEDKQLIMTTHSEHIVGRLLTLVAEKKLSSDEVAIYAFEKDEEGVCTANELEITEDGRVKGGLKDFFEADLGELDRYIKALEPSD